MRRALYGFVGLMVGVITYVFLIVGSPVIADVDPGVTSLQIHDDHMKEDLRDVKGDVTSFLEFGSYHLSLSDYQSFNPRVVKYGKVNPMFYYIHEIVPEESEPGIELALANFEPDVEPEIEQQPSVESDSYENVEPNAGGRLVAPKVNPISEGFNKDKKIFEKVDASTVIKHFSKYGVLPVDEEYYQISSAFGKREDPFSNQSAIHSGLDIAAPGILGKNVYSASHGKVLTVANEPDSYGQYVVIAHDGYNTLYGHLSSFAEIAEGDVISAGSLVGQVGSTGRSTGPHLHFEVTIGSLALDPVPFINEIRKVD